jgi:hypothetical protein
MQPQKRRRPVFRMRHLIAQRRAHVTSTTSSIITPRTSRERVELPHIAGYNYTSSYAHSPRLRRGFIATYY